MHVRLQRRTHNVSIRLSTTLASLALLVLAAPNVAVAQSSADIVRRPGATRPSLEAFVREQQERKSAGVDARVEAAQRRLRDGDFAEGEQIVLRVAGQPALTDTFTVEPGLVLALPGLAPVSMQGLLRSELQAHLGAHIARFVRDAQVSALTLVRVGVLGEVRSPGFYRVTTSTPLSEVLMAAGGPTTQADLNRVSLRRVGQPADAKAPTESLPLTHALDELAVQSGDQVLIGAIKKRNWSVISQTTTVAVGLIVAVASLTAR